MPLLSLHLVRAEGLSACVEYLVDLLGGDLRVPTIDGYAKLKLAPGTENGKTFRLRGKGMPHVDGYGRGDLHVRILAEVPAKLSSSQKKLLRDFRDDVHKGTYPQVRKFEDKIEKFFERKEAIKSR